MFISNEGSFVIAIKDFISMLFMDSRDVVIKDLRQTVDRLQTELEYRDQFEQKLIQRIEELENE